MIPYAVLAMVVACPPVRQEVSEQPTIAREAKQARLNVAKWITARKQYILADCLLQSVIDHIDRHHVQYQMCANDIAKRKKKTLHRSIAVLAIVWGRGAQA